MRKLTVILLTITIVLLGAGILGCAAHAASALAAEETEATPAPIRKLAVTGQSAHPALMGVSAHGDFIPEGTVSRSELCQILYSMLEGLSDAEAPFSDFASGQKGYEEASALYDAGLLSDIMDGDALYPRLYVTRQDLTSVLVKLAQRLEGDQAQNAKTLAAEVASGQTSESGAAGGDKEPVLRQELAVVLERLAQREPDEAALFLRELLPADIDRDCFAWAYIADAVADGAVEPMEAGVHRAYNWLYATWENGTLIVDMDYGVWTFGLDGAYTTGDEELDGYLAGILEAIGAEELSTEEALEAAYLHVKYNYEYMVRPEDLDSVPVAQTGWEYDRAVRFFRYGGGTCYGFAAAFGLLARALGENAYIVAAEVNEFYAPHGFVVIPEDGVDWIYDVELEATRQERHADLELFHIENHVIYNYWYEPDWAEG